LAQIRWIIVLDQKNLTEEDNAVITNLKGKYPLLNIEVFAIKSRSSVSGNAQRNFAIDLLKEGYVYFLDDDNVVHPNFWPHFSKVSQTGFALIGQQLLDDGKIRKASGHLVKPSHIDAAQYCIPISMIGKTRWKEDAYAADGLFIGYVYHLRYNKFVFIDEVIAHYNLLK